MLIEEGVRLIGNVKLGEGVSIGAPAELMAKDSLIEIGDGCDIAAFVTLSTADSSRRCVGLSESIERRAIRLGSRVFVGTRAVILGGTVIEDLVRIGPGAVVKGSTIGSRAKIGPNAVLINCVVAPGEVIPACYSSRQ